MNKVEPEISVIVPIYNTSKYINKCLDSILNQTFVNFELICVDDGSTDGCGRIIDEYEKKDERVRVFHRETPRGSAAVPRNYGLDKATGKYMMLLDSDDWFDECMFEKMYNMAEKYSSDLVMCDNYLVDENENILNIEGELHHKYLPEEDFFSMREM